MDDWDLPDDFGPPASSWRPTPRQDGPGEAYTNGHAPMEPPPSPPLTRWVTLDTIELTEPQAAFMGYLAPEPGDLTILFGDGGSGKGTLAAAWAADVTREGGRVLIIDGERHPGQWRRRVHEHDGDASRVDYWDHPGGDPDVEDYADRYALVILDSAAYFMPEGVDMWSPEGAVHFQRMAARMGTHVLLLGHVSKASTGPYGSVYFRNAPTVALGLRRDLEGGVLWVSKANDVEGLEEGMEWGVVMRERVVTIEPRALVAPHSGGAPAPAPKPTRADLLLQCLDDEGGDVSAEEAAQATGMSRSNASRNLHTLEEGGRVTSVMDGRVRRWSMA